MSDTINQSRAALDAYMYVDLVKRRDINQKFTDTKKYIWGTGYAGELMYNILGFCNIQCDGFLDNNKSAEGTEYFGKIVYLPSEERLKTDDPPIIFVPSSTYGEEIIEQLVLQFDYPIERIVALCRMKPLTLVFQTSGSCNLKCSFCPYHGDDLIQYEKYGDIGLEDAQKILDQASEIFMNEVIFTGAGEPLLNPNFLQILEYALTKINKVRFFTNGVALTKEISEELIMISQRHVALHHQLIINISLTGFSDEVFAKNQGSNQKKPDLIKQKIYNNISYLLNLIDNFKIYKRQIYPNVRYMYTNENKQDFLEYAEFWSPRVQVLASPLLDNDSTPILKEATIFSEKSVKCTQYKMFTVEANGDVRPCCVNSSLDLIFGNAFRNSITEIIGSKAYREFIDNMDNKEYDKLPSQCKTCYYLENRHYGSFDYTEQIKPLMDKFEQIKKKIAGQKIAFLGVNLNTLAFSFMLRHFEVEDNYEISVYDTCAKGYFSQYEIQGISENAWTDKVVIVFDMVQFHNLNENIKNSAHKLYSLEDLKK